MAQSVLNQETITCAICLDLLKDPVTLPCGHSYCKDCIHSHWYGQVKVSCPQCRQSFVPRPPLVKTTVLANLVEELKRTGLTVLPSENAYAGPGDVSCDLCAGRKLKAVKSCLHCLVSFCENHLQPHHEVAMFQKHQLVLPYDKLQENLCPQHNKLMEIFCRTDQKIICYLCCVDQHKTHDTVSSVTERDHRQGELQTRRTVLLENLHDKEIEQKRLRKETQDIRHYFHRALQCSVDSFRKMHLLLEKKRSEVEQQIRSEEQLHLKPLQELLMQQQQDITELKKNISELDTLCLTPDHNQFIQLCSPLLSESLITKSQKTQMGSQGKAQRDFKAVTTALSNLEDKMLLTLKEFNLFEPSLREDFLRHACDITLDPNTANYYLSLSEGNTGATHVVKCQGYPDHLDRFLFMTQVLSKEALTGRCYWEVESSTAEGFLLGVTYQNIDRKGYDESVFGKNNKSWGLECKKNRYTFWFDAVPLPLSGPLSNRIGVYLDHSAGALSFYSVNDKMINLLHKVQTTFTQPLHVGLLVYKLGDTVCFSQNKQ